MKIGILGHGFIEWGGGLDFLRIICESLQAVGPEVELHLLLPIKGPRLQTRRALQRLKRGVRRSLGLPVASLARMPERHIVEASLQSFALKIAVHEIDSGSAAIARAAQALGLSAVLPSVQPLKLPASLPWLGYIADFQHSHLPQFFSAEEIAARDRNFAQMMTSARAVIVNARAVQHDIQRQIPGGTARVVALPFSAAPNPVWLESGPPPLERYGIRGRYFIISNQFWQHKDHLCAFRAFALLREQMPDVQLVCTGETNDFRNPSHFKTLMAQAEELGISTELRVLGLIPKADQIALLRGALAVVQPTRFEGGPGGGSVFDAVALGVPAIVSDAPVNLEIDEPRVSFFPVGDAQALAQAMLDRARRGHEPALPAAELLQTGRQRRQRCGQTLVAAIEQLRTAR